MDRASRNPQRNPMASPASNGNNTEFPQCTGQTHPQLSSRANPSTAEARSNHIELERRKSESSHRYWSYMYIAMCQIRMDTRKLKEQSLDCDGRTNLYIAKLKTLMEKNQRSRILFSEGNREPVAIAKSSPEISIETSRSVID